MTLPTFLTSLASAQPPDDAPILAIALWWDARGDWDLAHQIAQDVETPDAAWVHAYLHRKEGDPVNAAYWYRQAVREVSRAPLKDEWTSIVTHILATSTADAPDRKP